MTDLYNKDILRWTLKIPFQERLKDPDYTVVKTSRICGSRITMDVNFFEDGSIQNVGWEVKACALGQAAAAIVGQNLIGLSAQEFQPIEGLFRGMVKGKEAAYPDKWRSLADLSPVKDHPGRHGSVSLPIDCLHDVFGLKE